jgi:hypothetical protein
MNIRLLKSALQHNNVNVTIISHVQKKTKPKNNSTSTGTLSYNIFGVTSIMRGNSSHSVDPSAKMAKLGA